MANSSYNALARYYERIYSWKDYKRESQEVIRLIQRYKESEGRQLLDVACGTGAHLAFFQKKFSCTGMDLNFGMLSEARKKIKKVKLIQANMMDFKSTERFDVITCLFSAIGHLKTYPNLNKAIRNFAKHLKKGGVVIIEPWFTKQAFTSGKPYMVTYQDPDTKIARLNVSRTRGNLSILEMHYLIAEKNKKVKYIVDSLELGLFEVDKTLELMKNAGLESHYLKDGFMKGRGLFVGVKR